MKRLGYLGFLLAAVACAGDSGSNGEQEQLSFRRIDVPVGTGTGGILAAFVNDDDHRDLLVVGGDRLIILHGRGDGRFDVAGSMPAPKAVDLAAADLDEDGRDDLVLANHETNHVTLLFGTPDGGFEARATPRFEVNVSPHPHAVELHDTNGDGHADLLVDDRHAEGIRMFPGRGDGGFAAPSLIPVGGDPYRGLCLARVDDDAEIDLVTPNPDHIAVLLGDGSGEFSPYAVLRPGFYPFSAVAADVDGDKLTDVIAGSGEGRGALAVWYGESGGEFRGPEIRELADGPIKLAAADLTGDGFAEVIATSYMGGGVAVLAGGSDPALHRLELPGHPYGAATGDFNGDGSADFAVTNDEAEHVTVFLSRP